MSVSAGVADFDAQALVRNLEAQVSGYQRLITLAERQHSGLIGGESEDLTVLLGEQESVIVKLQALEGERMELLAPLVASWERPAEEITLRALEPVVGERAAAALAGVRGTLTETVTTLEELNSRNRRLLGSAVRIVGRWRSYMLSSLSPAATYSSEGAVTRLNTPRALDQAA